MYSQPSSCKPLHGKNTVRLLYFGSFIGPQFSVAVVFLGKGSVMIVLSQGITIAAPNKPITIGMSAAMDTIGDVIVSLG